MSDQNQKNNSDLIAQLGIVIGVLGAIFGKMIFRGASAKSTWTKRRIKIWIGYFVIALLLVYSPSLNIPSILDLLSMKTLAAWIYFHVPLGFQAVLSTTAPFAMWLAALGLFVTIRIRPYQKAIDHLGLKTPTDLKPRVIDVLPTHYEGQKKILVKAVGFALTDFQSKKAVLESSLNQSVQDIRLSENNRQVLEIRISQKELSTLIPYDNVNANLTEPFSFLVGDGLQGFMVSNLMKVHHLLVAGSSGGGKSFFVKQLIVGLLESSKHIQLYLIDLKKGVEVKVFEKLENVFIAKNGIAAIHCLDAAAKEMDRRFEYLEKHGYTEIDCKRDGFDRIVVLVDEASEVFTLVKSSKATKATAEHARDIADRIAKLGRAAGVHLILATQKVVKETIDTRVQLNINARMIFRVNTKEGSMTVLGNKAAHELPEIGGRGIWSFGNHEFLVQTPKLDNKEVAAKVLQLTEKFNGDNNPLLQKMLTVGEQAPNDGVKDAAFVPEEQSSKEKKVI